MKHLIFLLFLASPVFAQEKVDLEVVHRIRQEAFKKSQVMDHLFYLVEVNGPRITGSPGFQGAADWAVSRLEEYGLKNARQEKWGPFGVGWSRSYYSAHLMTPQYEALIGVPIGWTPSTKGVVRGTPVLAPLRRYGQFSRDEASIDAFIEKHKGKLDGRIVLLAELKDIEPHERAEMHRFSNDELAERAKAPDGSIPLNIDYTDPNLEVPEEGERLRDFLSQAPAWYSEMRRKERMRIQGKLNKFLADEGVALVILPAANGDGGTVFPPRMGDRDPDFPAPPPAIALTPEQYNRIVRLVEHGMKPQLEAETRTTLHRDTLDSINVVAEIPGGEKADEVVMLGGHLDSTEAALGATDNGAGCAVMMEAVRILRTLNLPLARTVRIALWGGEEQGLLGSEAYVKEHFGDPETMHLTAEHDKLSGYFNVDNGSGKIRGVYLQENDMVRPIFESWLRPFQDLDARTLSIRNTGGTDHLSFDAVGLPGFQFIQDPLEYNTRTHHSNMDAYDRAQPEDLMQAAAIVASFIYHAANRDEMLPRKPLPDPDPLKKP